MIHPHTILTIINQRANLMGITQVNETFFAENMDVIKSLLNLRMLQYVTAPADGKYSFIVTDMGKQALAMPNAFFDNLEEAELYSYDDYEPIANDEPKALVDLYVTKDSGERVEFATGSRRDTSVGKPRFDLIGKWLRIRLAGLLARGAVKYDENNWKLGQPMSRTFESMERHMNQWRWGDREEDHLAAIAFNAMSLMHVEEEVKMGHLPEELIDLDFEGG